MENQDKNHTDEPIPKNHFTPNSRYFTILVYALAFVLGAILIYIFIGHFNVTLRLIGQITHLLSPFITGAFIAFVLYPLVHLLYRCLLYTSIFIDIKYNNFIVSIIILVLWRNPHL